jgi:hypothetical protein
LIALGEAGRYAGYTIVGDDLVDSEPNGARLGDLMV